MVFVPYWTDIQDPHEFLAQLCNLAGVTGVNASNILSMDDIIFIVDEAQSSYGDDLFWLQVVKYQRTDTAAQKYASLHPMGARSLEVQRQDN